VEGLRQDVVERTADVLPEPFPAEQLPPESASSPQWLTQLLLLWDKRRILIKTAIGAFLIATVVAFLIPKRFDSTVMIMPPDSVDSRGMMMAAFASKEAPGLAAMASNILGMKSSGALFISLLRSRTVEDQIVDQFNLRKEYGVRYEQDARKILESRTSISEDRKSGTITIVVSDHTPPRARDIAQSYVGALNSLVSRVSTSSARRERIFIEQRLAKVKADLEDAEQQFSKFASKNTALDITEQTKAMVESAATLQGQLIVAQSELEGLRQIYNPNNVRVRSAQARVDELKRQLQKISGTDASAGRESSPDEPYPSIRRLPILGVQWADLYRRVKTQETVYELLSQQYELARIQEAKEVPTVNVVDAANLPEKKSWPHRAQLIILLTLSSVALAIGLILGKEAIDRRPDDDSYRQLWVSVENAWSTYRTRWRRRTMRSE
jgi:capsule polysaccharide export protein KpsE/RkpR